MKRFSEQLKKKSESIRLRAPERADLRARLESYMEYHPLPAELQTAKKMAPTKKTPVKIPALVSEPFKTISLNMTYVRGFAGVFALFIVVGVPALAERSVPGDILYPVKTNITEEVRASLTLSPYAKVQWETKRLERRVAEARLLADAGKLTPETEADVALAVQEHSDAVTQEIATIRENNEEDADIAEIAFASALSVQAGVLEGYADADIASNNSNTDNTQVGHSVAVLTEVLNTVSNQADVVQAGVLVSYGVLLSSVEGETSRAYDLFVSVQKSATSEDMTNMERRLADVERKIVKAIRLHENGAVEAVSTVAVPEMPDETVLEDIGLVEQEEVTIETLNSATGTPEVPSDEAIFDATQNTGTDIPQTVDTPVFEPTDASVSPDTVLPTLSPEERDAQAVVLLKTALTDVQKLIIFMSDIDVRENITIEELVPMTFTDEERITKILSTLDEVLKIQSEVTSRTSQQGDISEKVTLGVSMLESSIEAVQQALKKGELPDAENTVKSAYDIASDMQKMIAMSLEKEEQEIVQEDTKEQNSELSDFVDLPEEITQASTTLDTVTPDTSEITTGETQ